MTKLRFCGIYSNVYLYIFKTYEHPPLLDLGRVSYSQPQHLLWRGAGEPPRWSDFRRHHGDGDPSTAGCRPHQPSYPPRTYRGTQELSHHQTPNSLPPAMLWGIFISLMISNYNLFVYFRSLEYQSYFIE